MKLFDNKILIIIVTIALLTLLFTAACAPKAPPPPPPAPPAGTIAVDPTEVDYAKLEENWPAVAARLGIPEEAVPAMSPALTILAMPVTFTGSGWPSNKMVFVDLVIPPDLEMKGLDRDRGEDSVGIAVATADSEGSFEAVMEATAKLNWLLRTDWLPTVKPDISTVKPLPNGTYTIRATGIDPRTMATATWELQLVSPAGQ